MRVRSRGCPAPQDSAARPTFAVVAGALARCVAHVRASAAAEAAGAPTPPLQVYPLQVQVHQPSQPLPKAVSLVAPSGGGGGAKHNSGAQAGPALVSQVSAPLGGPPQPSPGVRGHMQASPQLATFGQVRPALGLACPCMAVTALRAVVFCAVSEPQAASYASYVYMCTYMYVCIYTYIHVGATGRVTRIPARPCARRRSAPANRQPPTASAPPRPQRVTVPPLPPRPAPPQPSLFKALSSVAPAGGSATQQLSSTGTGSSSPAAAAHPAATSPRAAPTLALATAPAATGAAAAPPPPWLAGLLQQLSPRKQPPAPTPLPLPFSLPAMQPRDAALPSSPGSPRGATVERPSLGVWFEPAASGSAALTWSDAAAATPDVSPPAAPSPSFTEPTLQVSVSALHVAGGGETGPLGGGGACVASSRGRAAAPGSGVPLHAPMPVVLFALPSSDSLSGAAGGGGALAALSPVGTQP
jgi:hypothetical protein